MDLKLLNVTPEEAWLKGFSEWIDSLEEPGICIHNLLEFNDIMDSNI